MADLSAGLSPRYDRYRPRSEKENLLDSQCRVFWTYRHLLSIANLFSDFHKEIEKVPLLIEAVKKLAPGMENKIADILPLVPLYDYPLTAERMAEHQKIHNNAVDCYQLLEYPDASFEPLLKGK